MFLLFYNLKRIARLFTSGVEVCASSSASVSLISQDLRLSLYVLAKLVVVVSFWLR